MSKRKDLKRGISIVCMEMIAETMAASLSGSQVSQENILSTVSAILRLKGDYLSRISHVEPGMEPKTYFKNVKESFARDCEEMWETISSLAE